MHIQINKYTILPILLVLGMMIAIITKVAVDGSWEKNLELLALGFLGGLTFLFTDTVVELIERDRPHEEWFQEPNTWVKVGGGLSLLAGTLLIFEVI